MKPFVKGLPVKRVVLAGSFGLLVLIGCRGDERPFEEAIEVQRLGLRTLTIERPEGAPERVPDGVAEDFSIGVGERLALSLNGQGSGSSAVEIDTGDRDWRVEDAAVHAGRLRHRDRADVQLVDAVPPLGRNGWSA